MPNIFSNGTPGGPPSIFREEVKAGVVLSVFGRTGHVIAMPGDYSASMVTNAVDQTQSYADPPWITSLAWGKITGAPPPTPPAVIQDEGAALAQRGFLNFVGAGVSAVDDVANNRITVTVVGGAVVSGPTTSIQVNNAGALIGYSNLTYDGLTLKGAQMAYVCANPEGPDPNYKRAWDLLVYSDNLNLNPNFAGCAAIAIDHRISGGYYNYDGTTSNKSTSYGININLNAQGASQAFGLALTVVKDSMGDCGAVGGVVRYRGGPLTGDEGQCYQCFTYLVQDSQIVTHSITSVRRSACPSNMTVTQAVTASKNPQTVNVSGTAGLAVNDWLVAGQSADTGAQHIRAIQVTAFTGTTITAVIPVNMVSGDSLKAALVLGFPDCGKLGQLVPLVNLSGIAYSTGTVGSISGFGDFFGSGTAWAANVIGGDSLNVGAISLVADNVTATPFDSTPPESGGHMLRSWYQIRSVASAGQLQINSYSVAGDLSYRGYGPGAGTYLIRPAARALWFPDGATAVCEYSPHVWSVGHIVESIICPYPDVTLQYWNMSAYSPGGTYRNGIVIRNAGHKTFGAGFYLDAAMGTGHDAPWGWTSGISLGNCKNGISIGEPLQSSIVISCYNPTTNNSNIIWTGAFPAQIGCCGNSWDTGQLTLQGGGTHLDFVRTAFTGELFPELRWGGDVTLFPPDGTNTVFLQLGYDYGSLADLELARPAPKEAEPRARLRKMAGWRMETAVGTATGELYFRYINDWTGTNAVAFGLSNNQSGIPFFGCKLPKRGNATAGVNYGSFEAIFETSIWHAGAPSLQLALLRAEPESMATDAHNRLSCYVYDTLDSSDYYPNRCFSVNDLGQLSIGVSNPQFSATDRMVTFNPAALTANRTITIPDASGTMSLLPLPSASAGSGKLWYDPADSNRVKYTP